MEQDNLDFSEVVDLIVSELEGGSSSRLAEVFTHVTGREITFNAESDTFDIEQKSDLDI